MKKKEFKGKLILNKETVSRLQDQEADKIIGGSGICSIKSICTNNPCGPDTNELTHLTEPYCCSYPYQCPIG